MTDIEGKRVLDIAQDRKSESVDKLWILLPGTRKTALKLLVWISGNILL